MINPKFRTKLLEIVDHQLQENNHAETNETLKRLIEAGYKEEESKMLIAGILLEEMSDMMNNQVPFNEKRYVEKLASLS
ncbi:hypothetical protein M3182_06895 [Mesobacillus maritimus]|uniref:hypothetical protein n=1 Tax=Mesobacillus maritimus TaxID=1643336 RepID=UPI00203E7DA9|nr:hypothetical protein [Mesobacillus maritimus]MCM3585472.1 hypothetical protein [Mesobacillus maritimus]MCM3669731.1 hypothetical protein [Mesobacillus maritimus]